MTRLQAGGMLFSGGSGLAFRTHDGAAWQPLPRQPRWTAAVTNEVSRFLPLREPLPGNLARPRNWCVWLQQKSRDDNCRVSSEDRLTYRGGNGPLSRVWVAESLFPGLEATLRMQRNVIRMTLDTPSPPLVLALVPCDFFAGELCLEAAVPSPPIFK